MTTPNIPFWTNTNLNLTKPDLSIIFNSYDLKYDTCNMTTQGCNNIPPNTDFKNALFPSSNNGIHCGGRHSHRVGRGVVVSCNTQSGANALCPYDDKLQCPVNQKFLGENKSGGNQCTNKCGGVCQISQNFICGVPNFKCSITNGYNECSGYM